MFVLGAFPCQDSDRFVPRAPSSVDGSTETVKKKKKKKKEKKWRDNVGVIWSDQPEARSAVSCQASVKTGQKSRPGQKRKREEGNKKGETNDDDTDRYNN